MDPVRLFEDFATLELISGGRAEMIVGRGAFVESFPLFGYDLDDYNALFNEHLELLLELNRKPVVTWSGQHRPALKEAEIAPRPAPAWLLRCLAEIRDIGGIPFEKAAQGIEILAAEIAPVIRKELSKQAR